METIPPAEESRAMVSNYVAGPSASLNKTTTAIMRFLEDEGQTAASSFARVP